jgi:hypothetical protein
MIISQISRPTGRLTCATPSAADGLEPARQLNCPSAIAGDDAQEHPDGQVALE